MPNPEQEIQQVKQHIATVCARREQLKAELQTGVIVPRVGLARLEAIDRELSVLDSRFKQLLTSGGYTALESASTLPVLKYLRQFAADRRTLAAA